MLIAPSILNANQLKLGEAISQAAAAGISRFHLDIMDGHFVPNLSYGPALVADFKQSYPQLTAEVHLMSDVPETLVPAFVEAGTDLLLLHYEAMPEANLLHWLDYLAAKGVKAGLVLNPKTDVAVLTKFAPKVAQVLLMTVFPGFGGQRFLKDAPARITAARQLLDQVNPAVKLEVDGGIDAKTAVQCRQVGADIFVVGSFIFKKGPIADQIQQLAQAIR